MGNEMISYSMKSFLEFVSACKEDKNIYAYIETPSPKTRLINFYMVSNGYIVCLNKLVRGLMNASGDTQEDFLNSINREILRQYEGGENIYSPIKARAEGVNCVFAILYPIFKRLEKLGFEVSKSRGEFFSTLQTSF